MESKEKLYQKWWFWGIILIVILVSTIVIKMFVIKTEEVNEVSSENANTKSNAILTYPELKDFLEEQGYTFDTKTIGTANWTYFSNENVSISATIAIETYEYIINYWDKSLKGDACFITDTSANISEEKQQQYNSYLKWKDSIGLTEEQIKEVLLKYYLENKIDE